MALKIPIQLVSRYDASRLFREIETINDAIHQQTLRHTESSSDIQVSQLLSGIFRENKLSVLKAGDRQKVSSELQDLKKSAPVVHVSFAVEPDAIVTQKIVQWFRKEISPNILIQVGVQPSIAAGCVVRTTNSYFDFSLRNHLLKHNELLIEKLKALQ